MSEDKKEPIDPLLIQQIENNLLLKQVLQSTHEIKEKQDANHLVTIALRDNDTISKANASAALAANLAERKTIDRTDSLWSASRFGLKLLAAAGALIPIVGILLGISQLVFHWPVKP